MSVLEVGFRIPDTPEELFELIGDPDEENQVPFTFVICDCGWMAPIGMYRLPRSAGETVRSLWPAEFRAREPIVVSGEWELWTHKGKLAHHSTRSPLPPTALGRGDRLTLDVSLRGERR